MWWRQSGQVNLVLFCPLYFLLVHINTYPCGGATCYKSTVQFRFLSHIPTQAPYVLNYFSCVKPENLLWSSIKSIPSTKKNETVLFFLTFLADSQSSSSKSSSKSLKEKTVSRKLVHSDYLHNSVISFTGIYPFLLLENLFLKFVSYKKIILSSYIQGMLLNQLT